MVEHQPHADAREPKEPQASACATSRTPPVAPDIEHFFCIYCGYDLTGHSGETRRCPECGRTTTLEELRAALAMQSISAWEAPVVPSLLFLLTAFFGFPCMISLLQNSFMQDGFDWFPAIIGLLFVVSAVAWGWALRTYLRKYGNHYDWLLFLGASHLVAVQIGFGGVVLGAMVFSMIRFQFHTTALIVAMASAVFIASSVWPHRYMKRRLPAYRLRKPPEMNANE